MFRDRDKALEALEEALLQDDEEEEETSEAAADTQPADLPDVDIYNTDRTDTDLENFSEAVYAPPRRSGCVLWFVLLTAAVLLLLACLLAKREGLL